MESLESAIRTNIVPNQEYFLQGSVTDKSLEMLLHRLRGLCDHCERELETFNDHEMAFSILRGLEQPLTLRVRRALDHKDMPYQLRYIGSTEIGDRSQPTAIRSSIDVATSSSVVEFLLELGYRLNFEYVARGYIFQKGRLKVTVSKIYRTKGGKHISEGVDIILSSYLVELSILAPSGQTAVGEEMKMFAEQLKPIVFMEKIDHKRLLSDDSY